MSGKMDRNCETLDYQKLKHLKMLMSNVKKFVKRVSLSLWIKLMNLSVERENFSVFEALKKFKKVYERKMQKRLRKNYKRRSRWIHWEITWKVRKVKINFKYKNVLKDISKLHTSISEGKIDEIETFIAKYPKLKICNLNNISAIEKSIDARQFHVYTFLRAEGFYSDKPPQLHEKIQNLNAHQKEKIRQEILKYTKSDQISLILTKCDLDSCSKEISFNDIREMLEELMKVREIRPVLEVLAMSDVKIVFDYNEESVRGMDPTRDEDTLGLAYFREGILYVGRNRSRAQRFGTFAHEATHFALYLLYENSCLPYRAEDVERERVWEGVVESIRRIYEANEEGTENIIKWVYEYYEEGYLQKAELIVRVNDLLAFYSDNPEKCQEVRESYRELFDFYEAFVLPDLRKDFYEIIKLNNDFELFKEIKDSKFQVKDTKKFDSINFESKVGENFLILSNVPQMTLSQLFKEISEKSSNKIDTKVQNIFINFERLQQESLRENLKKVTESYEILRIFIYLKVDESEKFMESLNFLKSFKSDAQIFLVAHESDLDVLTENFKIKIDSSRLNGPKVESSQSEKKFLKTNVNYFWNDLTTKSMTKILKIVINFKGEKFALNSFFPSNSPPSAESLRTLSSDKELTIKPQKPQELDSFIPRKFLKKIGDSQSIAKAPSNFIDQTRCDKFVVISDLAGSGKTTLLHHIHETLDEKFPNFWITFVNLREHKNLLEDSQEIGENFLQVLTEKILKFNELERKIFELKYNNNQVVILFDGFDEISPDCKKNSLKIFKLHKQSEKSQIWITTRTHLEIDLEEELHVEAHKILPLTVDEQIEFLTKFWEKSWKSSDSSSLRRICAETLVEKILKMNSKSFVHRTSSLIGITLQVRILGEYFEKELYRDFENQTPIGEIELKIKNVKFSEVYEHLLEKSVKYKERNSIFNNAKTHMMTYEALALNYFLNEKFPHLFGLIITVEELSDDLLEEFVRGGIIFYDKNKKIFFTHLTYGEFLLARFIANRIENFKENWTFAKDFFELLKDILHDEKFNVVKMFLNDAFKDFNQLENVKNFAQNFHNFVIKSFDFEWINEAIAAFDFSHFTLFLIKSLISINVKTFTTIIESKNWKCSLLSTAIISINDQNVLHDFVDEVFDAYTDNAKLFKYLMRRNDFGRTIFHKIVEGENFKHENFIKFWSKIKERNFEYNQLLKFFFAKDKKGKNFYDEANKSKNRSAYISCGGIAHVVVESVELNLKPKDQEKLQNGASSPLSKFRNQLKKKRRESFHTIRKLNTMRKRKTLRSNSHRLICRFLCSICRSNLWNLFRRTFFRSRSNRN